ncbi:MAG TPA: hypothetical protein VIZ65_08410 [Cellvibrionaceae bacterium]
MPHWQLYDAGATELDETVKKTLHHRLCVYAALLLWLFANASGMHGRHCLDGLEAPVSVHFDVLSTHDDDAAGHEDVESKAQVSALKISNFDMFLLAAFFLVTLVWPIIRGKCYYRLKTPLAWLTLTGLRPPLRAPPHTPF